MTLLFAGGTVVAKGKDLLDTLVSKP